MLHRSIRGPLSALACASVLGCSDPDSNGWASAGAGAASGGAPSSGGVSGGGSGAMSSTLAALIPPRIRRLTNAEYDATVQALLGTKLSLGAAFVPDARLHKFANFDRNEAQIVEPMLARQLQQAAEKLATEYVTNQLDAVLPCAAAGDSACARSFFEGFLPKAYRRPVTTTELDGLLSVVVGPTLARDGFRTAIALGIEAALQSTAFLYHSELGSDAGAPNALTLTNAEIAEALSYLLTGGPADATLAATADLANPASRDAQARRLLTTPGARRQLRRLIKQWLDIDQVGGTHKSMAKFPNYAPDMFENESNAFVDEVVFNRNGSVKLLLDADFTVGPPELAEFYGAPSPKTSPGLIDLKGLPRLGIFNRGAFLAMFATPELPSPVKRGVRFLTQALCLNPGDPNQLNLQVALPPLNPSKTTRQRFEEHSQGGCRACHERIDSVGFTFQHFNAIGAWEATEDGDAERPIDSVTTLRQLGDVPFNDRTVADSAELVALVADSEAARRCFARNVARFTTAAYGEALEQGFVEEWQGLQATGQDSVQELLIAFVKSRFFIERNSKVGAP